MIDLSIVYLKTNLIVNPNSSKFKKVGHLRREKASLLYCNKESS